MTVRTIRGSRSPGCSIAAVSASMGRAFGELLVGGVQVGDAARQPLFARIGRHKITSPSIGLISLCNNNSTVGRTGRIASQGAGRPDAPLAARWAFEVGRYTKIAAGGKSLMGVH